MRARHAKVSYLDFQQYHFVTSVGVLAHELAGAVVTFRVITWRDVEASGEPELRELVLPEDREARVRRQRRCRDRRRLSAKHDGAQDRGTAVSQPNR